MSIKDQIVLIDDDQDTLGVLRHFFEDMGFACICYNDALKAFDDISNLRIDADVVVTDLGLPGLSGAEFTQRMKTIGSNIPIILITGNRKVEVAVEAIREGAYDFVLKPIHFPQLLVAVERALYLKQVVRHNQTLKTALNDQEGNTGLDGVIGRSAGIRQALDLAKRVSSSSTSILISGESGTGKEIIAKSIHSLGSRRSQPFMAINCSAIPENLLESELFGHAKGSFTGASEQKIGLFEAAQGGTIFLDEIGDLSLTLQAKLLRVLQERKIRRIGESQDRPIRARIISATHKNLREEVESKRFREDLFFRLNVIPIWIPPLRERKDDIIPLADYFLKKFSAINNLRKKHFSKECLEALLIQPWRGNVRELENLIERALVLSETDVISARDIISMDLSDSRKQEATSSFDFATTSNAVKILSIEEMVNKYVGYVLALNHGVKEKTAKDLKIDRKTLYRRLRELDPSSHIQQ